MELGDFEPLFGEPKVEWSAFSSVTTSIRPFLFQVHAPDSSHLRVDVTDFFSSSFEAIRSIQHLEDMRDDVGIGGSWSEFLEYLVNSIRFGDVKLVLEGQSKSDGPESARLIAQKSKGMPRISVSLSRLVGTAANEAMSKLSLDIYKVYKTNHKLLLKEQEGGCQLKQMLLAEQVWCFLLHVLFDIFVQYLQNLCEYQEKSKNLQKQLDMLLYSKRHKSNYIQDKVTSDSASVHAVSEKQSDQNPSPMKAPNRVVPAHRRSKVRGAVLLDTEDD